MIPELKNGIINHLEANYKNNKPFLEGKAAYSETFFQDWREHNLFHAFKGLVTFVDSYEGVDNATLYSLDTLAKSFLQSMGIHAYPSQEPAFATANGIPFQQETLHQFASQDNRGWVIQEDENGITIYHDPYTSHGMTHEQAQKAARQLQKAESGQPW